MQKVNWCVYQLPAVLLSMSVQRYRSRRPRQHHGTNLIYDMLYANALFQGGVFLNTKTKMLGE